MTARHRGRRNRNPAADRPVSPAEDNAAPDRWRPWLLGAVCALFVVRPLFPSESAARQGDGLPVVMLWIALAVVWLLGVIGRRRLEIRFGWTDAAVLVLVVLHTAAAIWAATRGSPRPAVNMLWEWIAFGLSFFLARQLVQTRREAGALMAVMVALAVGLAGYGLYQYFYELPATRAEYRRDPDKALEKADVWYPPGSRERELFEMRLTESREPIATFALTNSLAGYLAPWLVVTAGIGLSVGFRRSRWRTWRAVAVCALPVAICLILTKSRSAYLATLLGIVLAWLFCRPGRTATGWKLPAAIAALAAALIAAALAVGGLDAKILSEASKSLGYRVQYWQSTVRMIADRPLVGCGPGNFQQTYTRYMLPQASEEIADPHNFLLEVWATAGTPAAAALTAVLGCFAYALWRRSRWQPEPAGISAAECPSEHADAAMFVFGGAAAGFVLSVAVGQLSWAPPAIMAVVIALPTAALAVFLLSRWVDDGPLPAALPAVGVTVLLVNLLAAGAIGFPGVAGTLWLLMAVGLNSAEDRPPRDLPPTAGLAALGMATALAVACYITAYGPVLRCQAAKSRARAALRRAEAQPARAVDHLQEAVGHLREAAEADPLAAEPLKELASQVFRLWLRQPTPETFAAFEACMKAALERAPHSAPMWRMAGDLYRQAYQQTGSTDAAQKGVAAYRQAVELYPNSSRDRANLALGLLAAGDSAGFRREAGLALRLDELTPHADKKLEAPVRAELHRGLLRNSPLER